VLGVRAILEVFEFARLALLFIRVNCRTRFDGLDPKNAGLVLALHLPK